MARRVAWLVVVGWMALGAGPAHALLPRQVFGIGNTLELSSPRLDALEPGATRLLTPWDVALRKSGDRKRVDDWYRSALAAGLDPLLGFQGAGPHNVPTVARYRRAFLAALHRWPRMGEWQTWNEANYAGQVATWKHPRRAARYAKAMERACPRCTVLPITTILSDQDATLQWIKRWLDEYGKTPSIWAVHDYGGVNRGDSSRLRHFIKRHPRGRIWVTETGAWATFSGGWPYSLERQKTFAPLPFREALAHADRIDRVYWWEWRGRPDPARVHWDSGLLTAAGKPRPAYWAVLKARFQR